MAALNLLKLANITGDQSLEDQARGIMMEVGETIKLHPTAFTYMLCALDLAWGPGEELVLTGDDYTELQAVFNNAFRPRSVLIHLPVGAAGELARQLSPYTAEMQPPAAGLAAAYLCRNNSCLPPVDTPTALKEILADN